ncbi:MAG TPA: hypothetical protein VF608_02275 [Thermoanaerobaculia bacterium]
MFESIRADDASTRLRNAAIAPLAAFLFALFYFSLARLFTRVPATLFWSVTLIVLAGVIAGAVMIVRVVRAETIRGRAIAWLVAAILVELACLRLWMTMVLPWT